MTRASITILLFAATTSVLFGASATSTVRARLHFANGFCDPFAHVELVGTKGPVAEGTPDENCEVVFGNVRPGKYELKASGHNFSDTDSVITSSPWTEQFPLIVAASKPQRELETAANSSIAASDLGIPAKAQKQFVKANELASQQEFGRAIENLRHAIAIYPAFAGAYNSLGLIYARLGERERGREAFQRAVSINDHFAGAFLNLGSADIAAGNFTDAEAASRKASALNPADPRPLSLLAYSQLKKGDLESAIATSHRAHGMEGNHAFVHRVAARAFELQRNTASAISELETFLREEPTRINASEVRDELEMLRHGTSIAARDLTVELAW